MIETLSYSSTNVGTSSYITLVSSLPSSASNIVVVDTSTQLMKLAQGAAGSEVDICVFQGNGYPVSIPIYLVQGVRLALKAISSTASSGYNAVSFT